jgi:hypothetical protein
MVQIIQKNIIGLSNKRGKRSKKDKEIQDNERKNYRIVTLNEKKDSSIFYLTTISIVPWISLINCIKTTFKSIRLEIDNNGIKLNQYEFHDFESSTKENITAVGVFSILYGFNLDKYIIKNTTLETLFFAVDYCCNSDKIFINIDTSELNLLTDYLTINSTLYIYIFKSDYNPETYEASSITFHISNSSNDDAKINYTELILSSIINTKLSDKVDSDDENKLNCVSILLNSEEINNSTNQIIQTIC